MKPYNKILKNNDPISFLGNFKFKLNVQTKVEKPSIPLTIFTNNITPLEERKIWLEKIKKK